MANYPVDTSREQMLERPLPHSAESERAILGAIILDNSLVNQAIELLRPEDFYVRAHQFVFRGMIALSERAAEINPILLGEELRREGVLEQVGGIAFISELTYGMPHFNNVAAYAGMVRGKSTMRQLVKVANKITSEALEEEDEPEVILDHAEQMIFALADERTRQGFSHVKPVADALLEKVQEMAGRSAMLTGLTTGFSELDTMTSGLQESDLIIVAARPSMGKCAAAWTLIDDPQTGERLTLEECVERRQKNVFGVSSSGEVRATPISAWIDSGVKPVFRVTTRTGRNVDVTGHHPFLTINGWKPLYDLRVGQKIGVPRTVPAFGTDGYAPDLVRLIAYFIAEGGLTAKCPMFTNIDPVIVGDFQNIIARHFPTCVLRQDRITYKVVRPTRRLWKSSPNPVTEWLKGLGLWGKLAEDKSFPACVWRWTREHLAEFLRVLMSCDGTIYSLQGYPRIEFAVASEKLAHDVHHAFTRFGIVAKFWRKRERCWRVEITEPESVAVYQEHIGWLGEKASRCVRELPQRRSNVGHAPREAWALVRTAAARSHLSLTELARRSGEPVPASGYNPHAGRGIPLRRLSRYADVLEDSGLRLIAGTDIYWDEIISIESIGEHQVYDLTVPDEANFIAQDICLHNTSLCLTLAQNAAIQAGAVVGVFSLEMSKEALVMRMLCSEGRVDAHRFRSGFLSRDEWARLAGALGTLAEAKIFIDDTPGISVLEMRAKARRLAAEQKKLDLIVVDYLQLMSGSSRRVESRQQEVSQISRELKGLAKELRVPLVALSQLSRAPEARTDHRPQLADLRESGAIEQDADVVAFIYREEQYNRTEENAGLAELIVAKQRNGPTGMVKLAFLKEFTRFENMWRE
ncbi:MAG: replicative DNA helicase [Acidobacteria bacterium]|nr:replicative DNA helicase [Acidobacteriota bacterium]